MAKIRSVLFVCTGNSCRSIMAEALLRKRLKELGKDYVDIRSAGIRALSGMAPTENTVTVMKEEGVDVSGLKSKDITNDMIRNSDLILVMERLHKVEILRRVPEASSKTYLIKEFGKAGGIDYSEETAIDDPIGKAAEDYRKTLNILKKEIERIAESL